MDYSINYGANKIQFSLARKLRKTIKISVGSDLKVMVIAHARLPFLKIKEHVQKKARWINKKLNYFKGLPPKMPPRELVSGETHMYLGRQYRLKVKKAKEPSVKLKGAYIYLSTNGQSSKKYKQMLLSEWYKLRAMTRYKDVLNKFYERLSKYEILKPSLGTRQLKTRWGSFSKKRNTVMLNTELIKAPSHCIEYVVMHELCHAKYLKHDKSFYGFLSRIMPDWRKRKERLERVVI
ncbi:MAG: M48 family metallopeptidase [Candidatus Omnitrophica bacterium]|nr:M48 family metallopeptidase [Candidatus Omnitrophota bacterium]